MCQSNTQFNLPFLGMIFFLYYLNKVKSGAGRLCTACQNQWSVKLQHQTAKIIAQKGANVPATFTEHFYNDRVKKKKVWIYAIFSLPSLFLFCSVLYLSVGAFVLLKLSSVN